MFEILVGTGLLLLNWVFAICVGGSLFLICRRVMDDVEFEIHFHQHPEEQNMDEDLSDLVRKINSPNDEPEASEDDDRPGDSSRTRSIDPDTTLEELLNQRS